MGVLPLQFKPGENVDTLGLTGKETFTIEVDDRVTPKSEVAVRAQRPDGSQVVFNAIARLDTAIEVNYYRNGGILHTVLRNML